MEDNHIVAVQDEEAYWHLARQFVRVLIVEVNEALRQAGILEQEQRRKICEEVVFGIANFFDSYWTGVEGRKMYPLLGFAETFPDDAMELANLGPVHIPHKAVELHAMVWDEVRWYFEEQKENDNAVPMGCVGED